MTLTKKKLIKVLCDAQVLNAKTDYIHFERVWANIQLLRRCSDLVFEDLLALDEEINFLPSQPSDLIILTPDAVEGRLGTLPLSFLIAEKLGCNVVVWKEYADFKWGRAKLLGDLSGEKVAIIIQDIVESGTTALKILYTLDTLNVNWKVPLHYSIIHGGRSAFGGKFDDRFQNLDRVSKEDIIFRYGISVSDLGEGY